MYAAVTYVDTGRRTYAPGEVIREEYPGAAWHLKVGAIRKVEGTSSVGCADTFPKGEGKETSSGAGAPPSPTGEGLDEGKAEEDEQAETCEVEPEPPEIDVESAIIGPEPKPAKKSRKGAKK